MRIPRNSTLRRALVLGAAVVATLGGTTGPAGADTDTAGAFTGFEYAPASTLIPPPDSLLCATFHASASDPLVIDMSLTGSFDGDVIASGTATFTGVTEYDASPEGTYAQNSDCDPLSMAAVPGTMELSFTVGGTTTTCTDDTTSTYQRRATTAITLTYSGLCGGVATELLFSGGQEPCPPTGCLVTSASSVVEGTYELNPLA